MWCLFQNYVNYIYKKKKEEMFERIEDKINKAAWSKSLNLIYQNVRLKIIRNEYIIHFITSLFKRV